MASFLLTVGRQQVPLERNTLVPAGLVPGRVGPGAALGQVVPRPDDPAVLGLKNLSERPRSVRLADGQTQTVEPSRTIRLTDGLRIDFGGVAGVVSQTAPASASQPLQPIAKDRMERLAVVSQERSKGHG